MRAVLGAGIATGYGSDFQGEVEMLVSTTWNVAGHRVIETKGEVFGLVVRTRSLPMNFVAGIRSLFGGEIRVYTQLLESSRQQAVDRMVAKAEGLGANAVLSMRFDASSFMRSMTEIVAYGTAAMIEIDPSQAHVPAMPA
jgi:uncharacterized protein YbjQ (UPF0145 family)